MAKKKEAQAQFTELKKVLDTQKEINPSALSYQIAKATLSDVEKAGYGEEKKRSETMKFLNSISRISADALMIENKKMDDGLRKIFENIKDKVENPRRPTEKDRKLITSSAEGYAVTACEHSVFPVVERLSAAFKDFSKVLSKQNKPLRKGLGHVSKFANDEAIETLNRVPSALVELESDLTKAWADGFKDMIIKNLKKLSKPPEKAHAQFIRLEAVLDSPPNNLADSINKTVKAVTQDIKDAGYNRKNPIEGRFIDSLDSILDDVEDALSEGMVETVHTTVESLKEKPPEKHGVYKLASEHAYDFCREKVFPCIDSLSDEFKEFSEALSKQSKFSHNGAKDISIFANEKAIATLDKVPKFFKNLENEPTDGTILRRFREILQDAISEKFGEAGNEEAGAQFTKLEAILDAIPSNSAKPAEDMENLIDAALADIKDAEKTKHSKPNPTVTKFVTSLQKIQKSIPTVDTKKVKAVISDVQKDAGFVKSLEKHSSNTDIKALVAKQCTGQVYGEVAKVINDTKSAFETFKLELSEQSKSKSSSSTPVCCFANKKALETLNRVPDFLEDGLRNFNAVASGLFLDASDELYKGFFKNDKGKGDKKKK